MLEVLIFWDLIQLEWIRDCVSLSRRKMLALELMQSHTAQFCAHFVGLQLGGGMDLSEIIFHGFT